jgi:hypothetical protein
VRTYGNYRPAIIQHVKPGTDKRGARTGNDLGKGSGHRPVFDEGPETAGGIRVACHACRKGTATKYLAVRDESVAAASGRVGNSMIESPGTAIDRYIESKALLVIGLHDARKG